MNILFVWTSPFKGAGGVGRVTTTLGPEFVRQGHNVAYLALCSGEEYSENGITQYFCPDNGSAVSKKNLEYALKLIKKLNIDFIINQSGIYPGILKGFNKIRTEGLKIISVHHNCINCLLEHHSTIVRENYKNHILFPLIDHKPVYYLLKKINKIKYGYYFKYCIKNSDKLVLLSKKFIPELKTYVSNYPEEKVTGIPNPAPFQAVNTDEIHKENRILYLGRVNFQQKRADRIIEIWNDIYKKFPQWEFDVVGDGPALEELKEMADNKNLDRIHFHGYCDPRPFLENAKIFTLTSDFEGFGMVLVEAQAYGVVPIAFRCFSAIEDIIGHQENGVIINSFDIKSYIEELKELMENEAKRLQMARKGLKSVKIFDPNKIAKKWKYLFEKLKP